MFHANSASLFIYSSIRLMHMLVLPEEDEIFFLCYLHNSIFNINVVLQIDQLKKLISEWMKNPPHARKMNYKHRLILLELNKTLLLIRK